MQTDNTTIKPLTPLEALFAKTCFCKFRESCDDMNSSECMRHRNIYKEFMQEKREKKAE